MDWAGLTGIITALSGVLISFGAGVKWMLTRMDKASENERTWQSAERAKLEVQFMERIDTLADRIRSQEAEIEATRKELRYYVRHVGVLEGLLRANGVEMPVLELPDA